MAITTTLDMLFIIDATGSMKNIISGVKNHIDEIVNKVKNDETNSIIRLGIVAYRDYFDNPNFEIFNFTEDIQEFRLFLNNLKAKGGDDEAEDVLTGLEKASEMNWLSEARIIIHIGDYPCHGLNYHSLLVYDNYPQGDKYNRSVKDLLEKLHTQCNVNTYQFIHINNKTKLMIQKFKEEFEKENWYIENDLDIIENLTSQIYTSSRTSITRSVTLRNDTAMFS